MVLAAQHRVVIYDGATGTNLALDLATVQMFDSDEPEALERADEIVLENMPISS